ncbi:MAG TPA: PaaI family thioesterase [Actinomycetota bacterium]|nr:PaaI family thioesterase [Actinomycetota bacterium]
MSQIQQEAPRGSSADPRVIALPGLRRMELGSEGRAVPPPIFHLFGLQPTEASRGRIVFKVPASGWLQSAVGVFYGGVMALVADAPLGTVIMTELGPGEYVTTSELSLNFLRPATVASGTLWGKARVIHTGRSLGLSEISIEDNHGLLLAQGSCRCFVLKVPPAAIVDVKHDWPVLELETYDTPDPYLRPVQGHLLEQDELISRSGLELMDAYIAGEISPSPISLLTGLAPVEAGDGWSTWKMPCSGWTMSPSGAVYGGSIAFLADAALLGAVQTVAEAGTGYASLDMKVHFLRPAFPDGSDLTARAKVIHRGKRLAVASAEVTNAAGKLVAIASGSAMLLPGRMADLAAPLVPEDEASAE